ncbi:MAG: hypothetical protein IT532_11705 [Burkholderiales bacterium]|nr:hypothetical protein [Burkholderiales bacterium]
MPGNHDVPLYDLFTRLLRPSARYRRWIAPEADRLYDDGMVAVAALNTAHGWTGMEGRLAPARRCAWCSPTIRWTCRRTTAIRFPRAPRRGCRSGSTG